MRLVRLFSKAVSHSRQALYEPYIPPLTQEKVKALRKVMKQDDPKLHYRIPAEIERVLKQNKPSHPALNARGFTIERLKTLISTTYGPRYTIIDISLGTYAADIDIAPLELVIKDNSPSDVFLPGTESGPLTGPYDYRELARLLQREGFVGEFIDGDAITMMRPEDKEISIMDAEDMGPPVFFPPWPDYTPFPTEYIAYPPVLSARHEDGATVPFNLSPPMPTHIPLMNLIREYLWDDLYKHLVSIVYLWARSVNLDQITPTCIALMVIGYLQVRHDIPRLQNPTDTEEFKRLANTYCGAWIRGEFPPLHSKLFWIETAFLPMVRPPVPPPYKKIKHFLYGFFEFWDGSSGDDTIFTPSQQYVSVPEGTVLDREPTLSSSKALRTIEQSQDKIKSGITPWSPLAPPSSWQSQPIVVQDPLIPSYNHARNITKPAGRYFHYVSSVARRTLFHGHPLGTLLGPKFIPEPYSRHYSTENITIEAKAAYEALLPPKPVLQARQNTIDRVNAILRIEYGPAFHVEAFGSTRYGVSTARSDLDLILLDKERRHGFTGKGQLPAVYNVSKVSRFLSKKGFVNVQAIPFAKVPIVRFIDPKTNMECDLNINDRTGLVNTLYIRAFCELAPDLVRPMSLLIKLWAKKRYLNDPSGEHGPRTLSSYALNLMIIGYLQVRGVLPSLHTGLEPLGKNNPTGKFWVRHRKKRVGEPCDIRFKVPKTWQPEIVLEVGDALLGFFRFWGDEFDCRNKVLSVRHGGMFDRPVSEQTRKKKKKAQKTAQAGSPPSAMDLYDDAREVAEDDALAAWKDEINGLHGVDEVDKPMEESATLESSDEPTTRYGLSDDHHVSVEKALFNEGSSSSTDGLVKGVAPRSETDFLTAVEPSASVEKPTVPMQAPAILLSEKFSHHHMVLPDPFLMNKNLAKLSDVQIDFFRAECRRSAHLIESEASLKQVINGDEEGLPYPDKDFSYWGDESLPPRTVTQGESLHSDQRKATKAPKKGRKKDKKKKETKTDRQPSAVESKASAGPSPTDGGQGQQLHQANNTACDIPLENTVRITSSSH